MYASSLPTTGKITQNILPDELSRHMERAPRNIVTSSSPAVSDAEKAAADNAMQLSMISMIFVDRLELKLGVLTMYDEHNRPQIYKDARGIIGGRSKDGIQESTLANWNWASPAPTGSKNRHAAGLDSVDIAYFDGKGCDIFIASRGVTNDLQVSFENFHSLRNTVKASDGGKPKVLVADSAMCVDMINELIASRYGGNVCFLLHSTC